MIQYFWQTVILKIPPSFLFVLFSLVYGCRQQTQPAAITIQPDLEKGMSFLGSKNDSAFFYFNRAADIAKDSQQTAMAYNAMAMAQSDAGDYFGSQESLLTSLRYLNEQKPADHYGLLSAYNELGSTSLNLRNYHAAANYYDHALQFVKDDKYRPIALNNQAVAFQKTGDYTRAIAIYESILDQSKTYKKEFARIQSNLARAKWQQNPAYHAAPALMEALRLRQEENDNWGLNASYAHLADYYTANRPDSALYFAQRRYTVAQQLNSPDDKLEALEKLIVLSPANELKNYFTAYHSLNDSIQTARNAAKNQFALIRYGAEKSKADNLRLQQENTKREMQLLVLGLSFVFSAAIAWILLRKREQRKKLATSKKLHDTIANGLYRVMKGIEHSDSLPKEVLLDQIESLYEQSRNILDERSATISPDFQHVVAELLKPFNGSPTQLLTAGNDAATWEGLNDRQKTELEKILSELMINMDKHANAERAVLKFVRDGQVLHIHYTDDGVGLPPTFSYGNGLTNTENRIKGLGGSINFDRSAARGLKIYLHIPIA